jgi:hypothetical protein
MIVGSGWPPESRGAAVGEGGPVAAPASCEPLSPPFRMGAFMHLPWFRFYAEFGTDPVIQSLAFEDQRHYVILLCLKAQGVLDRDISAASKERIILRSLGLDPVCGSEVKRRLVEVKLVTNSWQILGWAKRQCESDVSTERVRKYRKTQGPGNVSDAFQKRSRAVSETAQNRTDKIRTEAIPTPPIVPPSLSNSNLATDPIRTLPAAPLNGAPVLGEDCEREIQGLNNSAFAEWDCERRRRGGKSKASWSDEAKLKSAKLLAKYTLAEQQGMVDASIANGWQGLFPPRTKPGNGMSNAAKTEYILDKVRPHYG